MLINMNRTPFDLFWRMFGIPIRVHPTFWLVSIFFSFDYLQLGVEYFLIGVGCVFVTILLHELGHALMFRAYWMHSSILLYGFGGLAIPDGYLERRSWRIIVSLAGPLTNFLISGLLWGSNYVQPWAIGERHLLVTYLILFNINLYLGILNLLPVWPLDGGKISRDLWTKKQPYQGIVSSLKMSIFAAIVVSLYSFGCRANVIPPDFTIDWLRPGFFCALLFALLALENYTELQNMRRPHANYYDDDRPPWAR